MSQPLIAERNAMCMHIVGVQRSVKVWTHKQAMKTQAFHGIYTTFPCTSICACIRQMTLPAQPHLPLQHQSADPACHASARPSTSYIPQEHAGQARTRSICPPYLYQPGIATLAAGRARALCMQEVFKPCKTADRGVQEKRGMSSRKRNWHDIPLQT